MPHVSVAQLLEDNRAKLRLEWLSGRGGIGRTIDSEQFKQSREGLIGHLNFVHPNWVQVFDEPEIAHVEGLDDAARDAVLSQLTRTGLACLIIAGGHAAPEALRALADEAGIPLLGSPVPSVELMAILRPYLLRALADSLTMHGVLLDVLGIGVLITGDSGSGKSELALELISRGSGLVADDVVELYRISPDTLEGRCPAMLKSFLEVRGLGVLNIQTLFGEAALRPRKNLRLIVHLEKPAGSEPQFVERLPLKPGTEQILGINVHKVTIPVAAGRNLAVLTEAAVRNYVLLSRGIDGTREFVTRQSKQLGNGE